MPDESPSRPSRLPFIAIALVGLLSAAPIHAGNVDFEEEALGPVAAGASLSTDAPPWVGFALSILAVEDGASCAPSCPDSGSQYVRSPTSGIPGAIFISGEAAGPSCTTDCGRFDLFRVTIAEPTSGTGPLDVRFQAFAASGGALPVQFQFITDGVMDGPGGADDFETVVLPDTYRDLESVAVFAEAPGIGVAIDDIIVAPNVTAVPGLQPSGALGLVALLAMSATRAARRARGR